MSDEIKEQQKQSSTQTIQTACLIAILVILVYTNFLAKPTPIMLPRYEYNIIWSEDTFDQLEKIGENGWDLVSARWVRDSKDNWGYEMIIRRVVRN